MLAAKNVNGGMIRINSARNRVRMQLYMIGCVHQYGVGQRRMNLEKKDDVVRVVCFPQPVSEGRNEHKK